MIREGEVLLLLLRQTEMGFQKGGKMKKIAVITLGILFLFFSCQKSQKVKRYTEGGVEVIENGPEPYRINGEPKSLTLEEECVMDFESDEMAKMGIFDLTGFDVDSEGNIYFSIYTSSGDCIYKFNRQGKFVTSFGRKGQGPGELDFAYNFSVNAEDRIWAIDDRRGRLKIYRKDGTFEKEIPIKNIIFEIFPLNNGNFLMMEMALPPPLHGFNSFDLLLYNPKFEMTKYLERAHLPTRVERGNYWLVSKERIYVGSEQRDYEIRVYNHEGKLIRKIRKKYSPVAIPESLQRLYETIIENQKKMLPPGGKIDVSIPKVFPPFQAFFVDSEERLFVKTYETGEGISEYVHDVFDRDGVLIGRKGIRLSHFVGQPAERTYAKFKNGLLYCFRNKENGYDNNDYEQFVVYKMKWK
jgi:hypothetical protein